VMQDGEASRCSTWRKESLGQGTAASCCRHGGGRGDRPCDHEGIVHSVDSTRYASRAVEVQSSGRGRDQKLLSLHSGRSSVRKLVSRLVCEQVGDAGTRMGAACRVAAARIPLRRSMIGLSSWHDVPRGDQIDPSSHPPRSAGLWDRPRMASAGA
jgi:hypothetical protein